jgi:two-component system sensor histidine kinase KdpD
MSFLDHTLSIPMNILRSVSILTGATLLSMLFHRLGFTDPNIIMVYILGVLLISITTSHRIYGLISSIASVLLFNFIFTVPRFSFAAYGTGYPVTFVVMFLTAFITGTFAGRCKEQADEARRLSKEKEEAAVLAKSEQLRANILRSISHDLRTPLTTISGNASNLLSNGSYFDEETKQQIYTDIYEDSLWLIDLVENLLYATRIEEGQMVLRTSAELVSEIVEEALEHVRHKANTHEIRASYEDDLLLVKADAKLVVQVIVNIVDNAMKYTPTGTLVEITSRKVGDMVEIRIADDGPGIPGEEKEKIFDKFYCGDHKVADNRRSLGLGLYLCKAIVEAHGGQIWVEDHKPSGAVFCFTLPLEEVSFHEPVHE